MYLGKMCVLYRYIAVYVGYIIVCLCIYIYTCIYTYFEETYTSIYMFILSGIAIANAYTAIKNNNQLFLIAVIHAQRVYIYIYIGMSIVIVECIEYGNGKHHKMELCHINRYIVSSMGDVIIFITNTVSSHYIYFRMSVYYFSK